MIGHHIINQSLDHCVDWRLAMRWRHASPAEVQCIYSRSTLFQSAARTLVQDLGPLHQVSLNLMAVCKVTLPCWRPRPHSQPEYHVLLVRLQLIGRAICVKVGVVGVGEIQDGTVSPDRQSTQQRGSTSQFIISIPQQE